VGCKGTSTLMQSTSMLQLHQAFSCRDVTLPLAFSWSRTAPSTQTQQEPMPHSCHLGYLCHSCHSQAPELGELGILWWQCACDEIELEVKLNRLQQISPGLGQGAREGRQGQVTTAATVAAAAGEQADVVTAAVCGVMIRPSCTASFSASSRPCCPTGTHL